jgi:hypothetical protein
VPGGELLFYEVICSEALKIIMSRYYKFVFFILHTFSMSQEISSVDDDTMRIHHLV